MSTALDPAPGPGTDPATGRRPGRRGGRGPVALGLLMMLAGVVLLSWTAWQFWGTNILSQRQHEQTVTELERQWARPARRGDGAVQTPDGPARAIIRVPAFGPDYAVPVLEGVSEEALAAGFGHFEGSAAPGQAGNVALAAHRVTHGEPLRGMPSLQVGDEIVVETREATYTYALTSGGDDLTVPFTETWMLASRPVNPDPGGVGPQLPDRTSPSEPHLLTLTTCSELFHTDNRSIAFATLVGTTPRT